jgi:cytochrome b
MEDGGDAPKDGAPATERVRVWDPGVRLFHWALAACVTAGWLLGEFGPAIMTWHFYLGYAVLALLGFRLVWGFVGPPEARFTRFLRGPGTVARYLRTMGERRPSLWRGHNPLGGWSVAAILLLLAAQAGTGLFADADDYLNVGPLAGWIAPHARLTAAAWHSLLSNAVLGVVLVHLAAIAFYAVWKRENLVRPMIDGWKRVRKQG